MTSDCADITESTRKVIYSVTPDSIGMSVARKVPLMQGVVAKIVMQIFQDGPYFALPNKYRFADIKAVCNYFQGQSGLFGVVPEYPDAIGRGLRKTSIRVSSEARRQRKISRCFASRYLTTNPRIIK